MVGDAMFPNPWNITRLRWNDDGKAFSFLYNQRGHQALRLLEVDANFGKVRAIIDEESKTFIDYGDKFRFSMNEGDYKAPDPKT